MSELLFNRAARVTIINRGQPDRVINGLRISFKIEQSESDFEAIPPVCSIQIYNVNENTRTALQNPGAKISLDVGYRGYLEEPTFRNVLIGDIKQVIHSKESASLVTKIEAQDSINAFQNAKINVSFNEGASAKQVFTSLAQAFALPLGEVAPISGQYLGGYVAAGLVKDELTKLCKKLNLQWSIINGRLEILPIGTPSRETVLFLSDNTGLIGSPSKKEENKIEFRALLNAKLTKSRRVQLSSRFIQGTYRITKVTHEGDTQDGPWYSVCEAMVSQ